MLAELQLSLGTSAFELSSLKSFAYRSNQLHALLMAVMCDTRAICSHLQQKQQSKGLAQVSVGIKEEYRARMSYLLR